MIEILIADDHPIFRKGLCTLISKIPKKINIIEAENSKDAYAKIIHYKPDIAFIDISMSLMNGFEVIKAAKTLTPKTRFVILTVRSDIQSYQEAMRIGASAFLSKGMPLKELEKCINSLIKGERYVDDAIKKNVVETASFLDKLTRKEIQVLKKLIEGKTNRQMADELGCGEKNIEKFKTNIRKKIHIPSAYGALLSWALQNKSVIDDFFI